MNSLDRRPRLPRFAALLLCCAAFPGAARAQGVLEGTIRDGVTGLAVAGAQVSVSALEIGVVSGDDGWFRIDGVPAGAHVVVVQRIGYAPERLEVAVASVGTTRLDVALNREAVALSGVVAVGSRARPRTVTESAVPVDVIPSAEIVAQGDTDFANLLRNVVPSFNVNVQPISDAATIARPANLRGLAPDHTLVLVNGKRRHRSAAITWYGNGLADGSQGPDVALIPGIAVEQAEVLRDGASAQYGSDAIAGVMNFVLANDRSGGALEIKAGGHALSRTGARFEGGRVPGDGETYSVAGNAGLPLGERGFLNLAGEYGGSNPTDRSVQRNDALALIRDEGNRHVRDPVQIWGSPAISHEVKAWANAGYLFSDAVSFYGHGNYARKRVEGGFYFRHPNVRSGVFGASNADGEPILLVGDMLDARDGVLDGSANCPEVRVRDGLVIDDDAWNRVLGDPNCFTFQKIFPGGFTPQFGAYLLDASAVAGLKGARGRLAWDASASWGKSNLDFYIYNTVNASLGPNQPCGDRGGSVVVPDQPCTPYFRPGVNDQQEVDLNVAASWTVGERLNLAGGAEWRNERFEIFRGDESSWTEGPLAAQGFSPGSNGFPGFGPLTEGAWSRSNFAGYGDLELRDSAGAWMFGVAGRVERFSDFGAAVNGKVAGRVRVFGALAVRGSASTGFRAPTAGQSNAFNISSIYDPVADDIVHVGTIPSTSPLALRFGGEPLEPEQSVSAALGAVFARDRFSLSADFFQVDVSDRLTTSADRTLTAAQIDELVREGVVRPGGVLDRFRFFINDFATRTRGVDLVAAYRVEGSDGSVGRVTSAWNWTSTTVTDYNEATLTERRIRILEEGLPNLRGNVAASRAFPMGLRALVRASYWGAYYDGETPYYESDPSRTIDYPARVLFDVEGAYSVTENWTLTAGAENVLNTTPEEYPGAADGLGNRFGQFTPFGFNGAFLYGKLGYRW